MIRFAFLSFLFINCSCVAQHIRLDPFGFPDVSTSIFLDGHSAYISGGTMNNAGRNEFLLLKFNLSTNTIDFSKKIGAPTVNFYPTFAGGNQRLDSSNILLGVSSIWMDSIQNPQFGVAVYNDVLDTIIYKALGDTSSFWAAYGIKINRRGEIVICGTTDSTGVRDFFFTKLNTQYSRLLTRTYGSPARYEAAISVDTCMDGGYIMAGFDLVGSTYKTKVVKIDSSGSLLWSKNNYSDMHATSVVSCKNGGYVISSNSLDSLVGGEEYSKSFLIKIDESGTVLWSSKVGPGGTRQGVSLSKELENTDIITCGARRNKPGSQGGYNGVLSISDSSGSIKFYKEYRLINDSTSSHYLRDVFQTNDGGYIAVGFIIPDDGTSQDVWILRVDSTGCEQVNCAVPGIKKRSTPNAVKVYPNPFSSELSVELDDNLSKDCLIQIFNSAGELVYSQSQNVSAGRFTISDFNSPPGIYLLSISSDERIYRKKIIKSQ